MEEEELLNLNLAIVSGCSTTTTRMTKRRRVDRVFINLNLFDDHEHDNELLQEGKILDLLQTREDMLRRAKAVTNEEDGKGLHLLHLLLITATSLDENNLVSTLDSLGELYRSCSLTGDSVQRVVACFVDGLAARLLTRESPFYDTIMKKPTKKEEFAAFTDFYRVSPFYQFAHFTTNQAIMEAFERELREEGNQHRALHVIDFDISYGFQWPSLIQSLSEKATSGNQISLRITGFGKSVEEMQETEARLLSFARGFKNLRFEFHGLLHWSQVINIRRKKQETVAVNLVFHLNSMNSSQQISETLKSIHLLNPSVVTLVEQEVKRSSRSFLSRFMESLHHFAAMFDSLDDCLPLESSERLRIEKNHLGKEIKSMLNNDPCDVRSRGLSKYEKMETWKGRMESHGFEGMKMSSKSLIQAKLLLKIRANCNCPAVQFVDGESSGSAGFRVVEREDGRALSLGWQDRCLITASTWQSVVVEGR